MNILNSQEASSPAQQGSPRSVTQHANNGLDEPVSDSNVSTTNHALAAVEAGEEWVDEGEELEVLCMIPITQDYHYSYHIPLRVRI
jgi:oligoribonuclease (3'-5' exoribonuclease)